jgi:apolipoprotein D and lipocalin family protein
MNRPGRAWLPAPPPGGSKLIRRIVIVALLALATQGCAWGRDKAAPPVTVEHVDLERYVGLWYEIAKIPNRFQRQCVRGTTAQYSIRSDGNIDVVNSCITKEGTVDEARGLAKVENKVSNAQLKVSFFRLLGLRLFWGDYWIIGLGDDYEYAVVGTPDRKYGWILSRSPEIAPIVLERILEELRIQGYDPKHFELTGQ